ncbi:MAG: hypothetical protein ACREB9_00180 [Thermoplasmata archaeon]
MAKLRLLGARVIVRRPPHWARNVDFVLASGPLNPEAPGQLLARAQLIDAATAAYGQRGFIAGIPVVAYRVAQATSGHTTVPGGAEATRQRNRQARHARAPGLAQKYRQMAGASGGGRAAAASEADYF